MFSFLSLRTAEPVQPKATIELFLDNSIILAGSSITGRVVITVFAESIAEENIFLQISGNEDAKYFDLDGPRTKIYNSNFKLFDTTFPLAICPGGFRQGQHTFTFNFLLPADLPPSFVYISNSKPHLHSEGCSVSYSLKAFFELKSPGHPPKQSKSSWDLSRGYEIKKFAIITPSISMVPLATSLPVNEYPMHYLGCCSSGTISFGAFLPNSVISAGEALDIYYVIENNSKGKILGLSVSIEGILTFTAEIQTEIRRMTTIHHTFLETQLVGKLSPKTTMDTSNKTIDELARDLATGSCGKLSIAIPPSAPQSIRGRGGFITLDYKIVLTLKMSWGYAKPVLSSGLTVHRNGLPLTESVTSTLRPLAEGSFDAKIEKELATIY